MMGAAVVCPKRGVRPLPEVDGTACRQGPSPRAEHGRVPEKNAGGTLLPDGRIVVIVGGSEA